MEALKVLADTATQKGLPDSHRVRRMLFVQKHGHDADVRALIAAIAGSFLEQQDPLDAADSFFDEVDFRSDLTRDEFLPMVVKAAIESDMVEDIQWRIHGLSGEIVVRARQLFTDCGHPWEAIPF